MDKLVDDLKEAVKDAVAHPAGKGTMVTLYGTLPPLFS